MKQVLGLVSCLAALRTLEAGKSSGRGGAINLDSIYPCVDAPTSDEFNFQVNLKTDGRRTQPLSGHIVALDPTIHHFLKVEKYEDGDGWKDYHTQKGLFCDDVLRYFGNMWTKFKTFPSPLPPALQQCLNAKGRHDLEDFKYTHQDLGLPSTFYGRFRVKWELFQNRRRIACLQGEGESIPSRG